ncbi:hypothetical protein D9M68_828450 [compost metagenome]
MPPEIRRQNISAAARRFIPSSSVSAIGIATSNRMLATTLKTPSSETKTARNSKSAGEYSRVKMGRDAIVRSWASAVPPRRIPTRRKNRLWRSLFILDSKNSLIRQNIFKARGAVVNPNINLCRKNPTHIQDDVVSQIFLRFALEFFVRDKEDCNLRL